MKLEQITKGCEAKLVFGSAGTEIKAITADSRKVQPGSLFIAVKGCSSDGNAYTEAAISSGAAAVISTDRSGLATAADNFYGHPSRSLKLVGITGTNGKTTTVTLLYRLFSSMGYPCGLLSTIANYIAGKRYETVNTTPGPIEMCALMRQMVDEGCEYCFMEVSSIGLEQQRTACLDFDVALFSNLTHDHLDYHGTFAEYIRCKKLFFDSLKKDAVAIINTDDRNGMVMLQNCAARAVTYSVRTIADHSARVIEQSFDGMLLRIDGTEVWSRLIGMHNAYNLLAIYSAALELGVPREELLIALSQLESAPGRLEQMRGPRGISVVIDYAHTPDAMENVLKTLREIAPCRELTCLFGCGGDRDASKRPEMAEVAERLADRVIVTADNVRTESIDNIFRDIRSGFSAKGASRALFLSDRREAIRTAILTAPDDATILLAGKGHEDYNIVGTQKLHFVEREIVQETFDNMI